MTDKPRTASGRGTNATIGAPVATGPYIDPHWRVRHDKVDKAGTVTLRHNSRLHHVGIGRALSGTRTLCSSTTYTSGSSTGTPANYCASSPSTRPETSSPAASHP
ncbi:hypothetical protein E1269_31480, partial [Jiangella asiatica]